MFDQWQQPLDIPALVRQGITLHGMLQAASLKRLHGMLVGDVPVEFSLTFGQGAEGQGRVSGWLKACLPLVCQRCLGEVSYELVVPVSLGIVNSDAQAKVLAQELEPLLVGEEPLCVADLIEDELLLALPVVPMHAHPCVPAYREHEGMEKAHNPFIALRGRLNSTH